MSPLPLMSKGERRHVKNKWLMIKGGAVKEEKTCENLCFDRGSCDRKEKFLS